MAASQIVNLDIGGTKYRSTYSTLTGEPNCMLAACAERWTEDKQQEIFIDRDGCHFRYILNYLRDGVSVILPKDPLVLEELKREAQFYKLPGLAQLVNKQISGDSGCGQVQQGSGLVVGNSVERVEEAASAVGVDESVHSQSKQQQNGEVLVPKAETEASICTNVVCVRQGKCGVLQHSDQHMTDVWMCPECYCTIALPQQQTAAVVDDDDGPVNSKPEPNQKLIAQVKTTRKNLKSPGPGPSKPIVKSSPRKKSTVQHGKKGTPPTHKNQSTAPVETNGGSVGPVHKCKECGRCYDKGTKLKTHMKTKHTVSPHKCNACDKCFVNANGLKQHINTVHSGVTPFQCPTCGNSFCRKSNLNRHMESSHGHPKFECEACGKQFAYRVSLVQHSLLHSGHKPYICEICGSRFAQSPGLSGHRRVHLQIKPHHCPKCNKTFVASSDMKKHVRTCSKNYGQ